jgi:hypothetical protein
MLVKMFTPMLTSYYGMHTAFPHKIWEAISGYNEVYDGWWGHDDIHFAYEMMVKGGCVPILVLAGAICAELKIDSQA